jgi:fermentation-respiration switch protein FrsA (DUF1100 family)
MAPIEKVRFDSGDSFCVGDLHAPPGSAPGVKRPAVAIIGPMTYQKEQAPTEYARRLATLGFQALAFDPRYRGESGGTPRCWENPAAKVEDLKSAVAFLAGRPEVDADRVFALGICQGSSVALKAAAESARIRALATIAGQYRDRQGDLDWLTESGFAEREAAGLAARQRYLESGEATYVAAVDEADMNVGMPGRFVWDWYHHWADRGLWENRYAVMSDADLLGFESFTSAQSMTKPWLMIHGDLCFLPTAARRHFEAVPASTPKELVWADTPHLAYYDQPDILDPAALRVARWFESAAQPAA